MLDRYDEEREWSRGKSLAEVASGEPARVGRGLVTIAQHEEDRGLAQGLCLRYARHANEQVRGAAVLGLGWVARKHHVLDLERAIPVINAALQDDSEFVRQQACRAMDDIVWFGDIG